MYMCRDQKDALVSMWHFLKRNGLQNLYESFCEGTCFGGPVWNHILEYWRASKANPSRVLFLRYERLLQELYDSYFSHDCFKSPCWPSDTLSLDLWESSIQFLYVFLARSICSIRADASSIFFIHGISKAPISRPFSTSVSHEGCRLWIWHQRPVPNWHKSEFL